MPIFGDFLKDLRRTKGYTLRAYAQQIGYDPGNYSRMERGLLGPPHDESKLSEMADALELAPGSRERQELFDRAAAARGELPKDLLDDRDVVGKLPLLFQVIRSDPEQLNRLVEQVRRG
jgi:transcriptional regulator with XRE-family HTH domain